ncbi:hypothetical protein H2200_012200 [Cladophialophora chaetospira]|uniref:aminodeoxychorismate synthase n=1 Tax=Cladophialophora chaetospira TaxID=386627 RepID=A0AA38WYF5_9EURO|nr:hypothetical protein H2200_012200 [Cladophialophora chaetospira]
MTSQGSVLFVDAYDSFAENIAALLHEYLEVHVTLIKIDCNIPQKFNQLIPEFFATFDAIVLGPGPGNPENNADIGLFKQVWEYAEISRIPVLGICLGFQSLCVRYGIQVLRMSLPCHGHAKEICHTDRNVFQGVGSILATCYNSLGVSVKGVEEAIETSRPGSSHSGQSRSSWESVQSTEPQFSHSDTAARGVLDHRHASSLDILAWDKKDWVMAVRHKLLPFHGFQFHPESCKSNIACQTLIKRWWEAAIIHNAQHRPLLARRQLALPNLEGSHAISLTSEASGLLSEMHWNSSTCKGNVERRSLHLPDASKMIADLCQQSSPADRVAILESTKRGRYSIYTFPHERSLLFEYKAGHAMWSLPSSAHDKHTTCLPRELAVAVLEAFVSSRAITDIENDLPFRGGFIGFISYEFGAASLQLKVPEQDNPIPSTPEISLLWVDRSVLYDHATGVAHVQSIQKDDSWVGQTTTTLQNAYEAQSPASTSADSQKVKEILSSARFNLPDHDKYVSQIRACQSELLAGNSYELCLTTEATITTPATPETPYLLYRNIQRHNPVPFASYLSLNTTTILSSSPEQFLSWSSKDCTIDMIPMKGTVKRSPDMTLVKATQILSSAKESAENLMIADLIRHDLYSTVGRTAKVEVVKLCDVIESETVYSLVSHIRAHAPISATRHSREKAQEMARYGIWALAHTLPPGSMTGAPKKRSCEILHDLECRNRGVYSGAIGYMDVCGSGAWSVVIRSAFSNREDDFKDEVSGDVRQKWRVGAGGAITVLSDEEQEWEEMMTKLESVLKGFQPA